MNKAFSLMELIIVILITGIAYSLIFTSNSFSTKEYKKKLTLFNIKEHLINNYEFKNKITFFCIEKDLSCYIKVDADVLEDVVVKDFFKAIPFVYEYKDNYTKIEFSPIKVAKFEEKVVFELSIDNDYKSRDFIVNSEDKYYLFNSVYDKPIEYSSYNDIFSEIESNKQELKYAF